MRIHYKVGHKLLTGDSMHNCEMNFGKLDFYFLIKDLRKTGKDFSEPLGPTYPSIVLSSRMKAERY